MCGRKTTYLLNDLEEVTSRLRVSKGLNQISGNAHWTRIQVPWGPLKTTDVQAVASHHQKIRISGVCVAGWALVFLKAPQGILICSQG